ncbi:arginyltransferase [Altererythrobacter sp. CC-YST694]|uniref:arginyltransferase n=1 Tax=Altererythrobacter sp. CC-YST694 TaxID=2755038 RepID=UPI001D02949A|nr:arginyltransferase [Altererythrobacter sp. CC-YST694]MCB5426259.1 arginyltransferase [Altererythrobacter sp. CC-YST694]
MTAPVRFPRFFVTSPAPCPYLPGRTERKVFTELKSPNADALNEALGRIGFRRSQTVAYRPSCSNCQACVSVRVPVNDFRPSTAQKRNLKRNADLVAIECRPWATNEQFELLHAYLEARHPGGGMAAMDEVDFADMVEHTPVSSVIVEYRERREDGTPGRLVGACLTDRQSDGYSMIYSFYDPCESERSGLGNYIILDHIRRAAENGHPYVYLGYWVEGSPRMQYKVRYRPLELLTPDGWVRMGEQRQEDLIAATAVSSHRRRAIPLDGTAKDGGLEHYRLAEEVLIEPRGASHEEA